MIHLHHIPFLNSAHIFYVNAQKNWKQIHRRKSNCIKFGTYLYLFMYEKYVLN